MRKKIEADGARLRSDYEATIGRQSSELAKLQQEIDALRATIRQPAMTNIMACRERVSNLERLLPEAQEKALYQGMLAVWESISIRATPAEEGLVFKDHFLNISVNVRNRELFHYRVETSEADSGFSQTLSATADIAAIAALLVVP